MTPKEKYEVVVVGAGPAGSTAARTVAEHGHSVLLLERRRRIGWPVQCGELLPARTEIERLLPESPRASRLCTPPAHTVTNRCRLLRLVSPLGSIAEFRFLHSVLDRSLFDQFLADRAVDAGAELCLETAAVNRSADNHIGLRIRGRESLVVSGRVVVGADGPKSLIATSIRSVYPNEDRDMSLSMQYVMRGVECDEDVTEMHFGSSVAPGGYAWIIPKGDEVANVGLGLRRAFSREGTLLRDYLNRFVKRNPNVSGMLARAKVVSRISAYIPVGGPTKRVHGPGVVLAGDAAGHVMASNGGGIPTALVAGELAGMAVSSHLKGGAPLSSYDAACRKEMGAVLEEALRVLRVADRVMRSDTVTDQCMRLAGPRFLQHLIRCRLPLPVALASKTLVRALEWTD
ncbi:MAG: geranylgeranyl reductase family protein [Candidatus Thorarchaeota archaeon]|nr:geranylgeranyl reductase family protein [Candidatus Thorarchaeota archaeon]